MRTAICRSWIGLMAIGLSAVAGLVPAAPAQDLRVLDHCKPAGNGVEAEERQEQHGSRANWGVLVEVPIGKVCLGPEVVDGEHAYVRRTTGKEGMAIVEVSTTPFMPVLTSDELAVQLTVRPDQPASW